MLHYMDEAVMLSSKKSELIYQKRRDRIFEKKRLEEIELLKVRNVMKRKVAETAEGDYVSPMYELKIREYQI